jgi:hypothetical protein
MARPSSLPVWATNANYVGGPAIGTATCVAPSASAQDEGWEPAQKPGAQNQNWYQNLVYQWVAWLAAGILDGTWQFTGSVTFDVGLTIAVNQNITLSGTGLYKRGARERKIMIANQAVLTGSAVTEPAGVIHLVSNGDAILCPIQVDSGETITEVGMIVNEDAAMTASVQLIDLTYAGDGGVGGSASSTAGAALNQRISVTGLSELVTAGDNKVYGIKVTGTTNASSALVVVSLYIVTTV